MIYTDGIHLAGDDIQELHKFATKITLSKCWWHNPRGKYHPHYDIISPHMVDRALREGAKLVTTKELLKIIKENLVD